MVETTRQLKGKASAKTDARVFGDRYLVVDQVGTGGMATVYLGRDSVLGRDVAIKVLHPHLASRDDARARFNREANAIARLKHTNIVDVYDFSDGSDDDAYLITEFVEGETLTDFCKAHGPFLPQAAALIGHAVAGALRHAHGMGIVHRDIKPDNLMISREGKIKLMDFGIATVADAEQMTATGAILGSPAHMAPEQIEGKEVDERVDVFAFGTLLYQLVTGELPFMASNPHALFRLILECEYDPPSRLSPAVGRRFEELIDTCLAREPSDRFSSMASVQDALDAYLREHQMGDVAKLLPRLLKAPEQFQQEWRPVLVQVLSTQGRRHVREGSLALAIDAYNRALAIDPDAAEPKRGLSDLTSRSRRHRRLRVGVGLAATLAVAVAVWFGLREGDPVAGPEPARAVDLAALPKAPDGARLRVKPKPKPTPTPEALAARQAAELQAAAAAEAKRKAEAAAAAAREADAGPTQVAKPKPTPRRHPRPNPTKVATAPVKRAAAGGSKLVEPPKPGPMIVVQLGSIPPNAKLMLDGKKVSEAGSVKQRLEAGRAYALTCEPPKEFLARCPQCPPWKTERFKVPLNPPTGHLLSKKCDFSRCCPSSAAALPR